MTRGPEKQFDRQEALERAMQVFWNQGYEATGIADLLRGMGIGRQSLYDTFGSKRELFLEALRLYLEEQRRAAERLRSGPGTVPERLGAFLESRRQIGPHGCLVGNTAAELGPHDPEIAEIIAAFFVEMQRAIAEVVRAGQDAGEVRQDVSPDHIASLFVVAAQGAALFTKVEGGNPHGLTAFEGLMRFLEPS